MRHELFSENPGGRSAIGIWEPVTNNKGEILFMRDPKRAGEWHDWANVQVIKPKGGKRRVLLFGESAARGFLYDPGYNFAKELQGIVSNMPAYQAIEIIDLAKIGISMDELLHLIKASSQLEPDALVVFAGNNWVYKLNDESVCFERLYEVYKEKPIQDIKLFFENLMRPHVEDFIRTVSAFFGQMRIPILFVIPEFNLGDWRSNEAEKILPWAPDDRIKNWLYAENEVYLAMVNDEMREAERNAYQMTMLDPSNPLGFELLAACHLRKGQLNEARKYLELSRDTILYNRAGNSMPRCISIVRKAIMEVAPGHGMTVVDLPEIFRTELKDGIPDRNLFLDYCHLTIDGIKIASRHIVQKLIFKLSGVQIRIKDIPDSRVFPSNEVLSAAHFSAAIYNAHHGQPRDIVEYHCKKAIDDYQEIEDTMIKYADFAVRKTPTYFCKSFGEIIVTGKLGQYEGGFCLLHPRNRKLSDFMLVDSILSSINSRIPEVAINELRNNEHGTELENINLLESFYAENSYNSFAVPNKAAYLQARAIKTCFHFVASGNAPLTSKITYRTPRRYYQNEEIKVYINDHLTEIAGLPMSKTWQTSVFRINADLISRGVNKLMIEWPYSSEPLHIDLPYSRDAFLKNVFPVFGEIFNLDLTTQAE